MLYWDSGEENGNYRDYGDYIRVIYYMVIIEYILKLYADNGKEHGKYYSLRFRY